MGIIANVLAGLIGSSVGQSLLGTWGPVSYTHLIRRKDVVQGPIVIDLGRY